MWLSVEMDVSVGYVSLGDAGVEGAVVRSALVGHIGGNCGSRYFAC